MTKHDGRPGAPAPATSSTATIASGDRIVALETDSGFRHLLQADGHGARKHKGLGVVDPDRLVGQPWGTRMTLGAKAVVLVRPNLADLAATLARKAQIILPKDASRIVFELGIGPGDRVFESGVGSGGLTLPLLWAVGASGHVVAQELREEFADWTRGNAERAGLADRLTIHLGDLGQGLAAAIDGPFQAAALDLPEPWTALPHLTAALAPGANVVCYTPQVSQMEQASRALSALGFLDVRQLELIERAWEVKERGSRPSFEGLGHTGFLVFGRWPGPAPGSP